MTIIDVYIKRQCIHANEPPIVDFNKTEPLKSSTDIPPNKSKPNSRLAPLSPNLLNYADNLLRQDQVLKLITAFIGNVL